MKYSILAMMRVALPSLVIAAASATAQQAPGTQYACYVPGSGTVYRIKEANTPAQCAAGHTAFQMSAGTKPSSGPTGPAGGDLGGSYPDPVVMKLQGQSVLNAAGSFDFSNANGLLSVGALGSGNLPASGPGTRFMWYPAKAALRAGTVDGTQWDLANIGLGSVALGRNSIAQGEGSFAFGDNTQALGPASTAIGASAKVVGSGSAAMGSGAQAIGHSSIALGRDALTSGIESAAIGSRAKASGIYSTALGFGASASGGGSVAIGFHAEALGGGGVAIGNGVSATGDNSMALGNFVSTNAMTGAFVYGDASSSQGIGAITPNQFVVRAQQFWLGTNNAVTATAGRFLETSTGAYLTSGGAWTNSSDVNRKHAFQTVDGDDVLDKLAAMPVQTWSYKTEDNSVRHMGPTAQEFRKAFGLGDTDKAIATVDADGVSLAGIKALIERTTKLQHDNEDLRTALAEVYRRLAELEIVRR